MDYSVPLISNTLLRSIGWSVSTVSTQSKIQWDDGQQEYSLYCIYWSSGALYSLCFSMRVLNNIFCAASELNPWRENFLWMSKNMSCCWYVKCEPGFYSSLIAVWFNLIWQKMWKATSSERALLFSQPCGPSTNTCPKKNKNTLKQDQLHIPCVARGNMLCAWGRTRARKIKRSLEPTINIREIHSAQGRRCSARMVMRNKCMI